MCSYCFLVYLVDQVNLLIGKLIILMGDFVCSRTPQNKTNYPASSTLDGTPFMVNDFVISTSTANIAHFATDGSTLQVCNYLECLLQKLSCTQATGSPHGQSMKKPGVLLLPLGWDASLLHRVTNTYRVGKVTLGLVSTACSN